MESSALRVNVIGLGYIGLPTALLIARSGITVSAFDTDSAKIKKLGAGELTFDEPGLPELFSEAQSDGTISFVDKLEQADVHIICVPTPTAIGHANLAYVTNALEAISKVVRDSDMVVLESTVGPEDCEKTILPLIGRWNKNNTFALCTERAIPGNTINEMIKNDRVVGVDNEVSRQVVEEIYGSFVKGQINFTGVRTAALVKVIENTYRSINIAFANELAKLADSKGFDVWEAIELANKHPRVNVHLPGPGVGGHCIPVDPYFLLDSTDRTQLIALGLEVNQGMPAYVAQELQELIAKHKLSDAKIGLLGHAYKKDVDDVRETPAERITAALEDCGYTNILHTDPFVKSETILETNQMLEQVEVVILVTDHSEYATIDFTQFPKLKLIYDTRNALRLDQTGSIPTYYLGK